MRIVLTGATGRLGTAITRVLGRRHAIVALARDVHLDDPAAVHAAVASVAPAWVIHTAAYNNVDGAEGDGARDAFLVNAYAPALVARAAASCGARTLHISTDYVFDGTKREGYDEEDVPAPVSTYGISKYLGECAVSANDPRAVIVRTSRLYGPPGTSPNAKRSFVDIVLARAAEGKPFAINRAEEGSPTYVDDLAEHLGAHILGNSRILPGIYHMANAGGCTWLEWTRAIVAMRGMEVEVSPRDPAELQRPARRPAHAILHSKKLPPMRTWETALWAFLTHS